MNQEVYTDCRVYRGQILYRGRVGNKRIQDKRRYEPYLFLEDEKGTYRTLQGRKVKKKDFRSISDAKQFIREHEELNGFKFYGFTNFEYTYIYDKFPGKIVFDKNNISIGSVDIECKAAKGFPDPKIADQEITLITLTKNNKAFMIGCKPYYPKDKNVEYFLCEDEEELLRTFLRIWQELDFDVISGWNIDGFDIPYLINRIINVLDEDEVRKLSPWGIIESREVPTKWGDTVQAFDIFGIASLDYIELYKKFSYKNQESYKLDYIAEVELGENKVDYSEYGTLDRLYELNFEMYADYNLKDAVLIDKLEKKLGFINIVLNMAYMMKCNFTDTFRTVKPWDVCIHAYLMDKGIVVPQHNRHLASRSLVGGFVKDINPGFYEWVASFDLKSSYPHQIISYNISPETLVKKINESIDFDTQDVSDVYSKYSKFAKENNLSMAGNLTFYSREKRGFFGEIMVDFFGQRSAYQQELAELEKEYETTKDERLKDKISSLDAMQLAIKIAINAFYGSLANSGSRWFSIDLAEAITTSGQVSVKWAMKIVNDYLNKMFKTNKDWVTGGDTDSIYLELKEVVKKLNSNNLEDQTNAIVKFCDVHLQKIIKDGFSELGELMNSYDPQIKMARENIANKVIWRAKKNYVMNVLDSKGIRYSEPKLKMTGLEAVKQIIPKVCRENMKEAIKIMMTKDEQSLIAYVAKFKKDFQKLPFNEVANPRGVNELTKYKDRDNIYKFKTPMHVRASLLYNHYILELGLDKKYPLIHDGNKMKFAYMKMPNPIKENVFAVIDTLPPELGLEEYIDYNTQFEKTFLNPVDSLASIMGWNTEEKASLESFFG